MQLISALWGKDARRGLHGRLAHAPGMVGQRSHLVLEEIGLDLDRVLHTLGIDQLVAEVECCRDVALQVTAELLGLIADPAAKRPGLSRATRNTLRWPFEGVPDFRPALHGSCPGKG